MYICTEHTTHTYIYLFKRGEGRKKERERNIDEQEKHLLVAFHTCPNRGATTQTCALTGIHTGDLSVGGMTPNPMSHTVTA